MTAPSTRIRLVATMTALLPAAAALAAGETITVDTLNDTLDFASPRQVGNLPGPDGRISFREALTAANNTAGGQTIEFAIPASEWWLYSDRALLRQEDGIFALNDDGTVVDFTTQTEFTGDTNPDGYEVGIYGLEPNAWGVAAIYVNGDNCLVKGLDRVLQRGYGIRIVGNDNVVHDCTISGPLYAGVYITGGFGGPTPTGNVIGGTGPGEGNVLSAGNSGVRIDGPAAGNVVIGNVLSGSFAGVEVRSAPSSGLIAADNRIGGPTPAERNVISGAGHYGEEGFPVGAQVSLEATVNTIVEGNYIGTIADGSARPTSQRGPAGIAVRNCTNTMIRGNLVSGIAVNGVNHYQGQRFGTAIAVSGTSSGTMITDNRIGTNADGTAPVPNRSGISVAPFIGSAVPSDTTIESNTIAFNELTGIVVSSPVQETTISANSIHDNGTLGIDLRPSSGTAGVTPNDPGDGDSGGNALQNFPVIASAIADGSTLIVEGTLNSTPNSTFAVEIFTSAACDESGHGEGAVFAGSIAVTTDSAGNGAFSATLPSSASAGYVATATATNEATGNTSEFSACTAVEGGTLLAGDATRDGAVDVDDLVAVILAWGTCPESPAPCDPDVTHDGNVNVDDLVMVITNWG